MLCHSSHNSSAWRRQLSSSTNAKKSAEKRCCSGTSATSQRGILKRCAITVFWPTADRTRCCRRSTTSGDDGTGETEAPRVRSADEDLSGHRPVSVHPMQKPPAFYRHGDGRSTPRNCSLTDCIGWRKNDDSRPRPRCWINTPEKLVLD